MIDFKTQIETLRLNKLKMRFSQHDEDWINKFWYESAIKYTKARKATHLEKAIAEYLTLKNFQAEKISVTGRMIDNTKVVTDVLGHSRTIGSKKYIPSTSTKGSSDLKALIYGLGLSIEVKFGKDKMSENQKKYKAAYENANGFYFVAHSEDDFLQKFDELLQNPKVILMKSYIENNELS